jgi:MoaA/NifB/PqqE/SkfB family radical SAM enzyme
MKRVDLKAGFLCNNNCLFCVQAHKKKYGNRSTEELKKEIETSSKYCQEIVFTGGEVTIRKDLLQLVRFARDSGFQNIQIQTNGRMLSIREYCKDLINAGATEFGPALHGHIPEVHDYLTKAPGAFNQTVQGIKNIKELGYPVVMNSVIVKPNYIYLPETAELFVKLNVNQYQFAFMHALGNGMKYYDKMMPLASLVAPYLKKGLQVGIDNGIKGTAEAMPLCMLERYEEYCSEFYMPDTEIRDLDRVNKDFKKSRTLDGKMKFDKCKKCIHNDICEGPWREYPEKKGESEFTPITECKEES